MEYRGIEYTVSYRNVKYPRVDMRTGEIFLILPYGTDPEEIIRKNGDRIMKKFSEIEKIKEFAKKQIKAEEIILAGKRYRIIRECGRRERICEKEREIMICPGDVDRIKRILKGFLRKKIETVVAKYSKTTGLKPRKISIREQITKWGSCSSRGNLNFNLRLVFTPADFLDYIVLHELLHLRYMNHGKEFRRELKTIYKKKLPDDRTMMKYWFRSEFMMKNLFNGNP